MDDKILFRGFRASESGKEVIKLNGEQIWGDWKYWTVTGRLVHGENFEYMSGGFVCDIDIIFETIGRWALTDKNGKNVFTGDNVKGKWYPVGEVCFGEFNYSHCDEYECKHYGFYAKADMSDRYIRDDDGYALVPSEVAFEEIELVGSKWAV